MLTRYKLSSHFNVDFDDNRAANQSEFLSHERGHDVNEDGVYGLGHKVGKISEKFYEEQEKIQKLRIEKIKNFCKRPEKEKNYYGENSEKYILDLNPQILKRIRDDLLSNRPRGPTGPGSDDVFLGSSRSHPLWVVGLDKIYYNITYKYRVVLD